MREFDTYCTAQQADKAAELGAPLERVWNKENNTIEIDGESYSIPTEEQITKFLRREKILISVTTAEKLTVTSVSYKEGEEYRIFKASTYEEAMKKAIDAALETLETKMKRQKIRTEKTEERKEIMEKGTTPYCRSPHCWKPRTKFDGNQFVCPECGWKSEYENEFIDRYRKKWNK